MGEEEQRSKHIWLRSGLEEQIGDRNVEECAENARRGDSDAKLSDANADTDNKVG